MLQQAISTKMLASACPALAPDASAAMAGQMPCLIAEERYVDKEAQLHRAQRQRPMFNREQRAAFDAVTVAMAAGKVTRGAAPRLNAPPAACGIHLLRDPIVDSAAPHRVQPPALCTHTQHCSRLHCAFQLRLPCPLTLGASFFIDGPGGTGKTFVQRCSRTCGERRHRPSSGVLGHRRRRTGAPPTPGL